MFGMNGCTAAADNVTHFQAITKVAGSFTIDHPDPAKKGTHTLSHNFVESPSAGENLYRFKVTTQNCQAVFALPDYYKFLNKNTITKVSPVDTFGTGYALLDTDQTCVTFTSNCEGTYNILLIGTRKDACAVENWTGPEPYLRGDNFKIGKEV